MKEDQEPQPEKKIVVDEDGTAHVEAETEAAQQPVESDASDAAPAEEPVDAGQEYRDIPLPPPSLSGMITMLATQAMVAMGMLPHPAAGTMHIRKNEARHLVDMIALLETKTQGNRTEEESLAFSSVLHELRMMFVALK